MNNNPANKNPVKGLLWAVAALLYLLCGGYVVLGYIVYTRLVNVRGSCDMHLGNRPDHFTNVTAWPEIDFSQFFIPRYSFKRKTHGEAHLEHVSRM